MFTAPGGVDRYWVAVATSNWNNTANWSTMSGGAGGASVPTANESAVFDANGIKYREFDGSNWGSLTTLDSNEGTFPQITFSNNVPVVVDQLEVGEL